MKVPDWRELPPLTTFRAFEATARLNGFSAAARSLNVTPAAIAQQVRRLEKDIGTSLVQREGRGLILTEAGRQLESSLREAFSIIATGYEDVRRREISRGVRVSTTQFFADGIVLPNLKNFWSENPGVQVTFSPGFGPVEINLDDFDICIRGGLVGSTWVGYENVRLMKTRMSVWAAPDLLATKDGDISELPWLFERTMSDVYRDLMIAAGIDPDKVSFVDPGSAKFEIDAAVRGFGLTISPEVLMRDHAETGRLVRVDTPLDNWGEYTAVFRRGTLPEPVQRFLDWLVQTCAEIEAELEHD